MNEEPEGLLLQTLFEIKQNIGELKQVGIAQATAFTLHCAADEKMWQHVLDLKLEAARSIGAKRVMNGLWQLGAAIIGAAGGFFGARHL